MPSGDGREDRSWRLWASAAVVGLLAAATALALVLAPAIEAREAGLDLWSTICRAVGLGHASPVAVGGNVGATPTSEVAWGAQTLNRLARADTQEGARIAGEVCAACHGDHGLSTSGDYPTLAGQSAATIYKQLRDYKSGARSNPMMSPMAAPLTDAQAADVAVYFARVKDPGGLGGRYSNGDDVARRLVVEGDPTRALPGCNACHGTSNPAGGPVETPALSGQQQAYLLRQLHLFATGERRNDLWGRMRIISGQLTDDEKARLASYYQGLR
jgi:cytochrome c553